MLDALKDLSPQVATLAMQVLIMMLFLKYITKRDTHYSNVTQSLFNRMEESQKRTDILLGVSQVSLNKNTESSDRIVQAVKENTDATREICTAVKILTSVEQRKP